MTVELAKVVRLDSSEIKQARRRLANAAEARDTAERELELAMAHVGCRRRALAAATDRAAKAQTQYREALRKVVST